MCLYSVLEVFLSWGLWSFLYSPALYNFSSLSRRCRNGETSHRARSPAMPEDGTGQDRGALCRRGWFSGGPEAAAFLPRPPGQGGFWRRQTGADRPNLWTPWVCHIPQKVRLFDRTKSRPTGLVHVVGFLYCLDSTFGFVWTQWQLVYVNQSSA